MAPSLRNSCKSSLSTNSTKNIHFPCPNYKKLKTFSNNYDKYLFLLKKIKLNKCGKKSTFNKLFKNHKNNFFFIIIFCQFNSFIAINQNLRGKRKVEISSFYFYHKEQLITILSSQQAWTLLLVMASCFCGYVFIFLLLLLLSFVLLFLLVQDTWMLIWKQIFWSLSNLIKEDFSHTFSSRNLQYQYHIYVEVSFIYSGWVNIVPHCAVDCSWLLNQ